MVPKVLKVFAVEGLHAPRYQSRPPTVRVSTGVVDRARSPVSIEGWGGSFTRASLKRSKTPYHPARLSEVGTKEVPQVLKDARAISSSTTPATVHLEPEARPVGKSHSAPVFTPHAEPVSIIPAKRRLRAGVLETVRPAKRRRLACAEDQNAPSFDSARTESPAVANTSLKRSRPIPPNPISFPTPASTSYSVSPSTVSPATSPSVSALDTPTTLTGSPTNRKQKSTGVPVSHKPVSGSARTKPGLYKPHESLPPAIVPAKPRSPSPSRSLVPARRRTPIYFGQPGVSQTKRRRISAVDIVELPTPLPLNDVASLELSYPLLTQPGPTHPPTQPARSGPSPSLVNLCSGDQPTRNSPASLEPPSPLLTQPGPTHPPTQPARSGPSPSLANICSGDQPTRNNPPIRASDLISHLVELTRGTAKPTRTLAPTSNESNPPVRSGPPLLRARSKLVHG
ncbi:hypothetical protein RSOL_142960, partial [Rhizoctonia solani AG-3 Rhs1AP]